ncbi:MAG: hypothetical protein GXN99_03395 [Candidatus Nanohaloarchaeota archaeon]|nr:hypothetical protein [Candidatus Nanohaloarchaeota archaeon]
MGKIKQLLYQKGLLEDSKKHKHEEMALEVLAILKASSLNALIHRYFSKIQRIYPDFFNPLKEAIIKANLPYNPDTYIGSLGAIATFSSFILIAAVSAVYLAIDYSLYTFISMLILSLLIPFGVVFLVGYIYPYYVISERKKSINNNLPFALNHLAAISYASVPLDKAFKMMIELAHYGEITEEFKRIIQRMEVLGEDILQAMKNVALTTPSEKLKAILFGIISIIESGGNLREYLKEMSHQALFNYRLERKKYLETLQTYADIYTAVLITAPLFLITLLAVINVVPDSTLMNYKPEYIMKLGIYIFIPFINLAFLLFLHLTQPEV